LGTRSVHQASEATKRGNLVPVQSNLAFEQPNDRSRNAGEPRSGPKTYPPYLDRLSGMAFIIDNTDDSDVDDVPDVESDVELVLPRDWV